MYFCIPNAHAMMQRNFTYYHLVIGAILLVMGAYILIDPPSRESQLFKQIPPMFMAGAFIAYGLFRVWRGVVGIRRMRREDTADELEERRRKLFPEEDVNEDGELLEERKKRGESGDTTSNSDA